jgi:hypothetical protein
MALQSLNCRKLRAIRCQAGARKAAVLIRSEYRLRPDRGQALHRNPNFRCKTTDQLNEEGGEALTIRSRVTQDRRFLSRIPALLPCEVTYDKVTRQAVVVDLSLNGAFISSKSLPPKDASVTISLFSTHLKKPLLLDGKIARRGWGTSEECKVGRFGVMFDRTSPELISLLRALISKGTERTPPQSAPRE